MHQVAEFFIKLFDDSDWPPRWHCGRWTAFHGWLYIVSDLLIWSAYFTIPLVILKYLSRKQNIRFTRLYFLFAGFILACGSTHFFDAIAFWIPVYRLNALLRLITAVLSWITVFYLVKLLPLAFSLKTEKQLAAEIEQRIQAEEKIRQLNAGLEERVLERTMQLANSEQKYRHLFENNPIPMWIMDLYSFDFLDVNEAAIDRYGYSREEFLQMTALDIRPKEDIELFRLEQTSDALERGHYKRGIWKHLKKDGTLMYVEVVAHNIFLQSGKARLILSNDVSARIEAEDLLRKTIKELEEVKHQLQQLNEDLENRIKWRTIELEAANKEMEAFTYSVSHDLRAPLRAIIGFTTILEEDYGSKLDEEAQRIMSVIKRKTVKMGRLIDDLLAFSRMGRQFISKNPINTRAMVDEVIDDLTLQYPSPSISWKIQVLPDINGDINTMRQVWINLISNALKYSSGREHAVIEIGSFPHDGQTGFFVKDNGVGFNPKYKHKLFNVFQRLHSDDEFEGTGVGLALVAKIISRHGGSVWADAAVDEGACFYFCLPGT